MNGAGKKVVVVTNSSSYEPRAEWWESCLNNRRPGFMGGNGFYPQRESKKGAECT